MYLGDGTGMARDLAGLDLDLANVKPKAEPLLSLKL
jgi:hypothetical protein